MNRNQRQERDEKSRKLKGFQSENTGNFVEKLFSHPIVGNLFDKKSQSKMHLKYDPRTAIHPNTTK